jgi:hypothetical protein
MLSGEIWTYRDDDVGTRIVTRPGERTHLRPDQTKGYKLPENGWMLEYGRGPVPTALPMALADAVLSCGDLYTVYRTLQVYGRQVTRNLLKGKI